MSTPRKKPWNRVNLPVYSLSSYEGSRHNMNICTYVTPVSMSPKQYAVSIYKGTKTLDNVMQTQHFILQILRADHISLVSRFSRYSGHKKDKLKTLRPMLMDYKGFKILIDALAAIELAVISMTDVGDHVLAICDVISYKNISEGEALTLDHLRAGNLISI